MKTILDICFCEEFSSKFNIPLNCCDFCHDDFNSGYADICEREIDGVTYQVCCLMLNKYDQKFDCNQKGKDF
jgi:hypothetical protein